MSHSAVDPELAAIIGPIGPEVDQLDHVPTIEEVRAYCEATETVPHKTYHQQFLPEGESAQCTEESRIFIRAPAETAYRVLDKMIPVNGGEIPLRLIVPVVADEAETFPVFVNLHGGGESEWTVDSFSVGQHDSLIYRVERRRHPA